MYIAKKNSNEIVARAHRAHKINPSLKAKVKEECETYNDAMDWAPGDIK
jgi:hypothetical protein